MVLMDNYDLVSIDDFGKVEVLLDHEMLVANIIAFEIHCGECDGTGSV